MGARVIAVLAVLLVATPAPALAGRSADTTSPSAGEQQILSEALPVENTLEEGGGGGYCWVGTAGVGKSGWYGHYFVYHEIYWCGDGFNITRWRLNRH